MAADPAFILAAAIDPGHAGAFVGDVEVSASLDALLDASVEVAVDFTHPGAVMDNVVDKYGADLTMMVEEAQHEASEREITIPGAQPRNRKRKLSK